jgi:uncharacterized membrane protein (UPF0127 family)
VKCNREGAMSAKKDAKKRTCLEIQTGWFAANEVSVGRETTIRIKGHTIETEPSDTNVFNR